MIKGIVFDKDGTLYSARNYVNPFAEHLAVHLDGGFMQLYQDFRRKAVVGKSYSIESLEQSASGRPLKNVYWFAVIPALHQMPGLNLQQESAAFSKSYVATHPPLEDRDIILSILSQQSKSAIVSNDKNSEAVLRAMGLHDCFDLKYFGANKEKNLDAICADIEAAFSAIPSEIYWVEDDVLVLKALKQKGYNTVLRKVAGFNYVPDEELATFSDIILEDDLSPLYDLLVQHGK